MANTPRQHSDGFADRVVAIAQQIPMTVADWDAEIALKPRPSIDAADLLALDLPPLRWIVPDLIPEGTSVLAAPPKIGKSCLIYQVGVEVALGGELLGRRIDQGDVLYLALEDGQRRGQERLRAALAGRTLPRGRLTVQWASRRIGEGLEEDISAWLIAHPEARMVAIDTLQKVRPASSGRRGAYELDVEDLGRLQAAFRNRPVALVIVHHARKEAGDDFLASVSGTYGITGSADTIVVVRRKRHEAFGSILVTGRDVPDAEFPVKFDGLTWHPAPEGLSEASFERAEVFRVIESQGPIFPKAIADALGYGAESETGRVSVQQMVGKLVDRGAVQRTGKGYVATEILSSISDYSNNSLRTEGVTRVTRDIESSAIACNDYGAHSAPTLELHRQIGGRWVCLACSPGVAA